jgi:hypothetical protein
MPKLESLKIGGTQITDYAMADLARISALHHLDLARTQITDAGIAPLLDLKSLATLKLSETEITDAGLRKLQDLPDLRAITLDETQVTAEGVARFARDSGCRWMASEEGVANELAKRVSAGDKKGIEGMLAIGLDLPDRGQFKTRTVMIYPQTPQDTERQRRRSRVEWDWSDQGKTQVLFAELSIRQGSAKVIEAGINELPKPVAAKSKKTGAEPPDDRKTKFDIGEVEAGRVSVNGVIDISQDLVVRIDRGEKPLDEDTNPIEWRISGRGGAFEVVIEASDKIPLGGDKTGSGFVLNTKQGTGESVINVALEGSPFDGKFAIRRQADFVINDRGLTFADITPQNGEKLPLTLSLELNELGIKLRFLQDKRIQ